MFLRNKSITFMLSTKRNAKNYTIHPPRFTILNISQLFSIVLASAIDQRPLFPSHSTCRQPFPAHYSIHSPPLNSSTHACPRRLLGARRSLVGMNDLGRNYETGDNNQMDLKIMSFNLNEK